jgi:hypothetical protein
VANSLGEEISNTFDKINMKHMPRFEKVPTKLNTCIRYPKGYLKKSLRLYGMKRERNLPTIIFNNRKK